MKYLKTLAFALILGTTSLASAELREIQITIKDHRFSPSELEIPANEKVKLLIHNLDTTAEEFESYELNREKIVAGGAKISVFVGPLSPGEYPFFGEFNPETAQGKIIVR